MLLKNYNDDHDDNDNNDDDDYGDGDNVNVPKIYNDLFRYDTFTCRLY